MIIVGFCGFNTKEKHFKGSLIHQSKQPNTKQKQTNIKNVKVKTENMFKLFPYLEIKEQMKLKDTYGIDDR
eukprot:UN04516